jgi:hypothetical protein
LSGNRSGPAVGSLMGVGFLQHPHDEPAAGGADEVAHEAGEGRGELRSRVGKLSAADYRACLNMAQLVRPVFGMPAFSTSSKPKCS